MLSILVEPASSCCGLAFLLQFGPAFMKLRAQLLQSRFKTDEFLLVLMRHVRCDMELPKTYQGVLLIWWFGCCLADCGRYSPAIFAPGGK